MASNDDIADFNRRSKASAAVPIKEMPRLSQIVGSPDPTRLARMQEFDRRMDEWRKSLITTGVLGAAEKQAITTASVAAASGVGAAGKDGVNGKDGKDGVNGLDGRNLVAIPPDQLGLVKHVWIAFRTDGVPGTGSIMDPFDGSTKDKFDTVMAGLDTYTDIHIGPGVFETRGNRNGQLVGGWYAREGWRIGGSGIDLTVLKMMDCPATGGELHFAVIGTTRQGGPPASDFIEVCDMTIDCNLRGQTDNVAVGAITLYGNRVRCQRVRSVDWGTKGSQTECFVIFLISFPGGGSAGFLGAQIEDCIVDDPYEGAGAFAYNTTALLAGEAFKSGWDLNNYDYNALIRGCIVDGTRSDGLMVPMIKLTGLSIFGKGAPTIEDNLVVNAGVGAWNDSWVERNVIIRSNRFINVLDGVFYNMGTAGHDIYGADGRFYHAITSIASTTTTATVNAVAHGFTTGNWVDIRFTGVANYEGVWKITVTDVDHFTFTIPSFSGSASGGLVVKVDARAMTSLTRSGTTGIVDAGVRHGVQIGSFVQIGGVTGVDAGIYNIDWAFVIAVTDTTFTYSLAGTPAGSPPAGEKVWWDRSGFMPSVASPLTSSGTIATFTTQVPHNYEVGDLVIVSGVEGGGSNSNYNGYFLITAVTASTFSYTMAGSASESTTRARYQNPFTIRHMLIDGNYIELTGPPLNNGSGAYAGSGIGLSNIFLSNVGGSERLKLAFAIYQNVIIRGNVIRLLDGVANGASINFGITLANVGNGFIEDNVIEPGRIDSPPSDGRLQAWQPSVPQGVLRFRNNRNYGGKLLRCFDYNSSRYYDEPERTFESVQLLQAVGF